MSLSVPKIAQVAHEANRALQTVMPDVSNPVSEPWDLAPGDIRASAIAGVQQIIDNPDTTPEQSHESWMAGKVADGWTHGAVKDTGAKTHPCLVPYADLPEREKVKDKVFGAIVRALAT